MLAAASLIFDYTLTVAVSLAAGAAALGSAFPARASHEPLVCLIGLTGLNWFGISESANALFPFLVIFVIPKIQLGTRIPD